MEQRSNAGGPRSTSKLQTPLTNIPASRKTLLSGQQTFSVGFRLQGWLDAFGEIEIKHSLPRVCLSFLD